MAGKKPLLTPTQKQWFIDNVSAHTNKEMVVALREQFGLNLTFSQVESYSKNNKIKTNRNTQFKKGHDTYNRSAVGTKTLLTSGYEIIKVAQPDIWQRHHHFIWEQHNPKIKDGEIIFFKDGDKTNVEPENLELMSRQLMLHLTRTKYMDLDPSLQPLAKQLAELEVAVHELEQSKKEQ